MPPLSGRRLSPRLAIELLQMVDRRGTGAASGRARAGTRAGTRTRSRRPPLAAVVAARGRGGRGAAPPPSPKHGLTAAIKAAPTVGFVWGDGPTGHSIKYAWRTCSPDGIASGSSWSTDRRLGAHSTSWPPAARTNADAEFTVIEIRIGGKGAGEGKASLTTTVVVDAASKALALEGYEAAPVLFKVTR